MAVRAAIVTGNFNTAGTWGLVDSTSYLNAESATESLLTTAYSGTRSAAFTPGAIVVSHIAVKLCERLGTTGTMSVHLITSADNVEVAGTEVVINTADLPSALEADLNGGWIMLKLSSPVTLAAATAYKIEAKTSSANMVDLFCDATADNICRMLITTTTGAPGAGDNMYIGREYTGAGTGNDVTVTMDNTATTDFGSAPTAANSLITPGIGISKGGTLTFGTTAATNYYLKVSNSIIIYSGGTLNIGTVATPIPRDSTATLYFDCGADGDYGLTVRNLGTFVSQGLSRTSGKNVVSCKLNTDEAAAQTTIGVDTDTGWLNGDRIVIASTTRTASQRELRTLNANANASDMTVSSGLTNAHSGTSPTQAEVILLTRNVVIQGFESGAIVVAYCNFKPTSQVDIDWTELRYLGANATGKRGLEIETTTGSFNMQYSSVHRVEHGGIHMIAASGSGITISNNVFYSLSETSSAIPSVTLTTGAAYTMNNNVFIYLGASSGTTIAHISGIGGVGTFTNNTVACCFEGDTAILVTSDFTTGQFSGNTIHSCAADGLTLAGGDGLGMSTFTDTIIWRTTGDGISFETNSGAGSMRWWGTVKFDGLTIFGCQNSSINFLSYQYGFMAAKVIFEDFVSNGDSTFATTNGFVFGLLSTYGYANVCIDIKNGDMSTVAGIKTAHTNDFKFESTVIAKIELNSVKVGAANEFLNFPANIAAGSYIRIQKHDQTSGVNKTLLKYGTITRETTTVHTGSQSVKLTPLNATFKLESPSFFVAVASGATLTPSVYVYEDGSYNGSRARLILKRNDAIGITADTVIDTATAASDGAWELLTGTTAAASEDGVMEFVIDCDGTAGNLFVDSFTVA